MKKTISILILGLLIASSIGSILVSSDETKEERANPLLLLRVYSREPYPILLEETEIISQKPGEWLEVIIPNNELYKITDLGLEYEIIISDVEKYDDLVRLDYHSFPDAEIFLQNIATNYPSITSLYSIGTSYEGRDQWCLEISDNPGVDEGEPGIFLMGLHHAREWPSLEICLYICDNLTSNYGIDTDITDVIDNNRIWIVPCVNPDGYVYDHDQGHDWRKNRHYFPQWGTTGVDLNRNYAGTCNGNPWGSWGSIGGGSVTNNPSSSTFNGPMAFSELETQSIRDVFLNNDICASISWHTQGELVLWPWGYSTSAYTPDDTYMSNVGIQIANRITQQDGTGTYTPEQSAGLYPTTGDTTDWAYGYSYYELGRVTFPYTIETCTSYHPPSNVLTQVTAENFDGAMYLLQEAQNISNVVPQVLPPVIDDMVYDSDGTYTVSWNQQNPAANPDYYQLDELTDLQIITDDAENGTGLWSLDGFQLSTDRYYSGANSYKCRNINSDVSTMVASEPIPVTPNMNLSFWTWYDIETNYDKAFVEVSRDGRCYEILQNYTDSSSGWIYQEFPLDDYVDESVYLRFRYTTDGGTLDEGFYIDEITPVPDFSTINTLSTSQPTTSYQITNNPDKVYYYRLKGHNTERGWGDFSTLEAIQVGQATQFTPITDLKQNWNFISLPFNQSLPKQDILINYNNQDYTWGNATTNNNPTGSKIIDPNIFGWNKIAQSYELSTTFESGKGYWLYSYQDCMLKSPLVAANNDNYITNLESNWNIVGIPFDESINKNEIIVNYNGDDYTWTEATTNANPTGSKIIDPNFFGWNRTLQSYEIISTLQPGDAYWVYSYRQCTIKT